MSRVAGKKRTREHVIADLSICFVEWHALRCGFTVERIRHDYGIDLELKTYNELGEPEPGDVLLQVRATDGLAIRKGNATFPSRIERAHLALWLSQIVPVVLVVFDAKRTKAYWLCIQDYFEAIPTFNLFAAGKTITVRVPIRNRVGQRTMRGFAVMRNRFRAQSRRPDNG
jgi:uncharacterized protein DUF4365